MIPRQSIPGESIEELSFMGYLHFLALALEGQFVLAGKPAEGHIQLTIFRLQRLVNLFRGRVRIFTQELPNPAHRLAYLVVHCHLPLTDVVRSQFQNSALHPLGYTEYRPGFSEEEGREQLG